MSLGEAIDRVAALYRQEGRARVDAKTAVAAWGYSSLNGASLRVLSALRQYGLLDGGNEDIRVSERALTILLEPQTSPEYAEALNAALNSPALFQEIMAEYGNDLPSDPALISYLVRKQEFGEQAAKALIQSFRESAELVRQSSASYIAPKDEHNAVIVRPNEEAAKVLQIKEIEHKNVPTSRDYSWHMSSGTVALLRITGKMPSPKDIARLSQWLDLVKLQIADDAAEAAKEEAAEAADFTVG